MLAEAPAVPVDIEKDGVGKSEGREALGNVLVDLTRSSTHLDE